MMQASGLWRVAVVAVVARWRQLPRKVTENSKT